MATTCSQGITERDASRIFYVRDKRIKRFGWLLRRIYHRYEIRLFPYVPKCWGKKMESLWRRKGWRAHVITARYGWMLGEKRPQLSVHWRGRPIFDTKQPTFL